MCLDTEIYLYQQASEMWPALSLGSEDIQRTEKVGEEIAKRERNRENFRHRHKARVHLKRFVSPSSIRAMMIDNKALIISWYTYSQRDGITNVKGSEHPGILLFREQPEFDLFYEMLVQIRKDLDNECDTEPTPQGGSKLVFIHKPKLARHGSNSRTPG